MEYESDETRVWRLDPKVRTVPSAVADQESKVGMSLVVEGRNESSRLVSGGTE